MEISKQWSFLFCILWKSVNGKGRMRYRGGKGYSVAELGLALLSPAFDATHSLASSTLLL
jgi:hypothetical protein